MKKIEAIIHPFKLDQVRDALLHDVQVDGITVTEVRGVSRSSRGKDEMEDSPYVLDFHPQLKIETVVPDALVQPVVQALRDAALVPEEPSGMIFVGPLDDAVRIRTGERGEDVL